MNPQQTLTQFITQELLDEPDGAELAPDDNLLLSGLIDSLGVMRLVNFIEETFQVEVQPEDVTIENFRTINVIADYLQRRSTERAQRG